MTHSCEQQRSYQFTLRVDLLTPASKIIFDWGGEGSLQRKPGKILFKLYLSVQALVLIAGALTTLWLIFSGGHDLYISMRGRECVWGVASVLNIELEEVRPESSRWTSAVEDFLSEHPRDIGRLTDTLEAKCSDYIRVVRVIYADRPHISIFTQNLIDLDPATLSIRALWVGMAVGFTLLVSGLLYGLMRWFSWLLRD